MPSVWLRTNTRALWLGMIPPLVAALVGLVLALGLIPAIDFLWLRLVGGAIAAVALIALGLLAWQVRQPRLAYETGHLLVYLRWGAPVRLPIDVVECFLLGQAPALLPSRHHERTETASVVIRLSERAREWSHVDVQPALGKWCDGYVTLRGTWCEPLDVDVVRRLNVQLDEVQSRLKAQVR